MTTYSTGNPIGSTSPKDLYDNAENLDVLLLDQEKLSHPDRLGVPRWTWHGIEERFADFLANSGYQFLADYAPTAGIEITEYNQVLRDSTGNLWRLDPSVPLPYTTDGSGMPEGGAFLSAGDASALAELDQFKADLADPLQGGDLVGVTTSTGSQTLIEALDSRVIYRPDKASLDALPSSGLSDGQQAMVLSTPFSWDASLGEWVAQGPINVKMYGAVGDGVSDDGPAVRLAVESLRDGETLHFPPGHYRTGYLSPSDIANWILITASGCTLKASPDTVVLEDFLIAVSGTFNAPMNIGSQGFTTGDSVITTASAHGLKKGNVVQLLSQINSYSTDAGDFQLGSRNPSSNVLVERRFSEIHRVLRVIDSTSFEISSTVLYPGYADNTTGLNDPMTGVSSAQIRKIEAVLNTKFYGLNFNNSNNENFKELHTAGAYWVTWEKCGFIAEGNSGNHVRTQSSYGIRFKECWSRGAPQGADGSGWNRFFLMGGTQNAYFFDCDLKGGEQIIDFTCFASSAANPFHSSDDLDGLTTQNFGVYNCDMQECANGVTSHPGTYLFFFHDNRVLDCDIGIFPRSLKTSIRDNRVDANSTGMLLTGFHSNTSIIGNTFNQVDVERFGPIHGGGWLGIAVAPMSVDTMNNNNANNVQIKTNTFNAKGTLGDFAIRFRHAGNGVPPDPSFTEFTDSIKTNLSNYEIEGNTFNGCVIRVLDYINGVSVYRNTFNRCGNMNAYFESATDSARHRVGMNVFDGAPPTNGVITRSTTLSYGYNTAHRVGGNQIVFGVANNSLQDTNPFETD